MVHDERVPFDDIEKGATSIFSVKLKNGVTNRLKNK